MLPVGCTLTLSLLPRRHLDLSNNMLESLSGVTFALADCMQPLLVVKTEIWIQLVVALPYTKVRSEIRGGAEALRARLHPFCAATDRAMCCLLQASFDQDKQLKFRTALGSSAGTTAENVEITSITESRRRSQKINVASKVRFRWREVTERAVRTAEKASSSCVLDSAAWRSKLMVLSCMIYRSTPRTQRAPNSYPRRWGQAVAPSQK